MDLNSWPNRFADLGAIFPHLHMRDIPFVELFADKYERATPLRFGFPSTKELQITGAFEHSFIDPNRPELQITYHNAFEESTTTPTLGFNEDNIAFEHTYAPPTLKVQTATEVFNVSDESRCVGERKIFIKVTEQLQLRPSSLDTFVPSSLSALSSHVSGVSSSLNSGSPATAPPSMT